MEEENRAYVLNMENIMDFVFADEQTNHNDSEITELYVMDEDTKNMSLSTKQMRELKSDDMTSSQTIRYDMIKMLLDRLLSIENEELTLGETIIVNTMVVEGLITEIKENDI